MKKIWGIIVAVLLTATIARAQNGWVNHYGDNRISLKFPVEPQELTPGSFIAVDKDSIAYIFTIVDFLKVANVDSVALAPMKATAKFASQLKTGLKQSLPDVDLPDFTIGKWRGFTSYKSVGYDSKKKRYNLLMFIIGNKLYSVSTVIAEGGSTKGRDDFWGSIALSN